MEEKLRHFSAKKRQFGHEIQPLIFDVNIQHIGPYRLSRPWGRFMRLLASFMIRL